ncbi:MAG: MFS transporter [Verrucomicrobia bacterium]|nr:MFS transporter [Verrucomicrobiota bacterium]MDA7503098.1 MFS transporter [bacterium]MDA7504876.1 MFS transporter [Akkermansiaceae bacterium]MDA7523630.1 MFS transporter [bacterium]MDA7530507.1 MFS transporter [bacterium]
MSNSNSSTTTKLSIMMFLQFFVWGAWFVTLFLVLGGNGLEDVTADAYSTAPIAAIIAPLFLGLIADRFFSSEKVMGVLMLVGGVLMLLVPGAVGDGNGSLVFWLFMGHMLCYMPTLGLGNTIAFTHLPRDVFPKVRVWGTVGWIVAGLVTGYLGWSASTNLFWMAGISSVALGAFCFCLPNTPPPSAGQPVNVRALFMVDAFKMFAIPAFAVFMICSTLICIPLAYYYSNASPFLANMGFEQPASAMSIGQMSEIFFMLLIPFFFRKLGVKWMIMIGMMAWVLRYILFALGAPDQVAWMLFAGIALHGICYDFFFVTGFMYADRIAPKNIKGQVQSMLVFFTQGVGMFIGFKVAAAKLGPVKSTSGSLGSAITAGRPEEKIGFFEQFGQMFSVSMPSEVDSELLSSASDLWKDYWMLPAYMAVAIAVIFFLGFWDKSKDDSEE